MYGTELPWGRLFLYLLCPSYRKSRNSRNRKDENTAIDRPKNYRAKVANASVRTTRSGPLRGFPGKIILALLRYFSRKPCLSGSICSKGPCSSTGCQSPDIHNLNKRSMQQTIIARQSPAPAWIPVIEKKKKSGYRNRTSSCPAGERQVPYLSPRC